MKHLPVWAFCISITILASACSSSSRVDQAPLETVPWPGAIESEKSISDDHVYIYGDDYVMKGGNVTDLSFAAKLQGGVSMAYTIYTLGGFSEAIQLDTISADYEVYHQSEGDSTALHIGLANYGTGAWEWGDATTVKWDPGSLVGGNYVSPTGAAFVAAVVTGPGYAVINSVEYSRQGNTNSVPPENLVAIADVGQVDLTWDPVDGALGYNVYRAVAPDFFNPLKMNAELLTGPHYIDVNVAGGNMYYYVATTVQSFESAYSEMVDIFVPQIDLPAPTNPRVVEAGFDQVTVAWDWDLPNPDFFRIYMRQNENFNLQPPIFTQLIPGSLSTKQFVFTDLDPNEAYYWRIAAVENSQMGRMTDDSLMFTKAYWLWTEIETVGDGEAPLALIVADGELSAAYLNSGGVDFARRNAGTWTAETALDAQPMSLYVDIAYGGGDYLISSYTDAPDDLWAAYGQPGSWIQERADGDGSTALGHGESGFKSQVAVSDTEYVIVHTNASGGTSILQTKDKGGPSWSKTTVFNNASLDTSYSLRFQGSNLYLLLMDVMGKDLFFGDRDGSWTLSAVFDPEDQNIGHDIDLEWTGSEWMSPTFDIVNKQFYLVNGTTTPWSADTIGAVTNLGRKGRLAIDGSNMFIVFTNLSKWYLARNTEGTWVIEPLVVTGASITDSPDIQILGGDPYILFEDNNDGKIKACRGLPPV